MTQTQRRFFPGEEVTLAESEARRLEELGFLVETSKYKPLPPPQDTETKKFGPEPA